MSLRFALDELMATGWSGLDSSGCAYDEHGRAYPTVQRVLSEFAHAGYELKLQRVEHFDCHRAEWIEAGALEPGGSVVAKTAAEAAVHALATLRRERMVAATASA